jgi:hypothetical protein
MAASSAFNAQDYISEFFLRSPNADAGSTNLSFNSRLNYIPDGLKIRRLSRTDLLGYLFLS